MNELARVVDVRYVDEFRLELTFSDGLVRELDFERVLVGEGFVLLKDPAYFAQVQLDPVAGTVAWPNGVDLDPDVLHGDQLPAVGVAPALVREYNLHAAG